VHGAEGDAVAAEGALAGDEPPILEAFDAGSDVLGIAAGYPYFCSRMAIFLPFSVARNG
jgi:hypothetical protein